MITLSRNNEGKLTITLETDKSVRYCDEMTTLALYKDTAASWFAASFGDAINEFGPGKYSLEQFPDDPNAVPTQGIKFVKDGVVEEEGG